VLVIDDETSLRKLIRRMLEGFGYRVCLAQDGEDGLRRFAEAPDRIDAVILDMLMPDLDGDEVFDRLRALRDDVPVLVASGGALDERIRALLARGRVFFLEKPFHRARLGALLDEALGRA
jgi:CheY-like chemotaxis protein